ncbi:hypothetical protein BOTBODRAFT_184702 [Botryobasidium botryosum FD-172 SS1]|uniref:Uncharacterized protein n=1 Tax=Botryobasidium botryosum (strain FD-172 SS1) TaxID=930990 RepID=A0A067MW05_BOTB1|nr:hypothetical protein BOTBODRAFT_184702 [Botryobasidium botryosum FD-172 SS1]
MDKPICFERSLAEQNLPMLARLDYDILFILLSEIDSPQTLLYLAVASRAMRDLIIPRFLFASVSCTSPDQLFAFERSLIVGDSMAGDAVRHLNLDLNAAFAGTAANIVERLNNLQSVVVSGYWCHKPRMLKTIASRPRLRSLELAERFLYSLEALRKLKGLVRLKIDHARLPISPESDLGNILSNSRDTLQELSVDCRLWDFPPPFPDSENRSGKEWVWPYVHTLNCVHGVPENPAFTRSFPSVRFFVPMVHKADWLQQPCNSHFVCRLESFEGSLNDMECARAAGAQLRRAVVSPGALSAADGLKSESYFSSRLRSLDLHLENSSPECLERLLDVAPNLTFLKLSLSIERRGLKAMISTLNQILRCISLLYLSYLRIGVRITARGHSAAGQKDFVRTYPELRFIPLVDDLFPDLRAVSLDWTSSHSTWSAQRLDWKKTVDDEGTCRLQAVSNRDGIKWMEYYDWAWRDEVLG